MGRLLIAAVRALLMRLTRHPSVHFDGEPDYVSKLSALYRIKNSDIRRAQ